ncbi:hypothetical protein FB446DRAFT_361701 [Lentinula raphanica]|nr:hypothetical protein FB446DRAFT_361701 [Lentinula raphanica]
MSDLGGSDGSWQVKCMRNERIFRRDLGDQRKAKGNDGSSQVECMRYERIRGYTRSDAMSGTRWNLCSVLTSTSVGSQPTTSNPLQPPHLILWRHSTRLRPPLASFIFPHRFIPQRSQTNFVHKYRYSRLFPSPKFSSYAGRCSLFAGQGYSTSCLFHPPSHRFHKILRVLYTRLFKSSREKKSRKMRFNLLSRGLSFEANLTLVVGILSVVGCVNGVPVQVGSDGSEGTPESKAVQSTADQTQAKVVKLKWGGSVNQLKHGTDTEIALSSMLAYLSEEEQKEWSETSEKVLKWGLPKVATQLASLEPDQLKLEVVSDTFPTPDSRNDIKFMVLGRDRDIEGRIHLVPNWSIDVELLQPSNGRKQAGAGLRLSIKPSKEEIEKGQVYNPTAYDTAYDTLVNLGKKARSLQRKARVKAAQTGSASVKGAEGQKAVNKNGD